MRGRMLSNMGINRERCPSYRRNGKRKRYPALKQFKELTEISTEFKEDNEEIIELYDEIMQQEEDYFF
jgi:hypothetical protein